MTGRTAAYGRAAFGWALKRGMVQTNPFAALPVSKGIAKRERVLSDEEIREIWRAADKAAAPYGSIVQLLILTGQRRGEVAGMTWGRFRRTCQPGPCRASGPRTAFRTWCP
jgi:integrase